jgi:hypothetical protein
MRKCKCLYCGLEFDRDKLPYVQVTNTRYAHKECWAKVEANKTQDEKDYEFLTNYIEQLFGIGYITAKIAKQIRDYRVAYGYTYSGMYYALEYWFEVRKTPIDKANQGIGIVPYVYDAAQEYFNNISKRQERVADALSKALNTETQTIIVKKVEKKKNLYDLENL